MARSTVHRKEFGLRNVAALQLIEKLCEKKRLLVLEGGLDPQLHLREDL
jgi:hypothetical protein